MLSYKVQGIFRAKYITGYFEEYFETGKRLFWLPNWPEYIEGQFRSKKIETHPLKNIDTFAKV
jgi:hypothetical protein